jgi:hypothetical protein
MAHSSSLSSSSYSVNEENKEKLRQAYLRGELMKKKSHSDYVKELERRLQNEKMKQGNNAS